MGAPPALIEVDMLPAQRPEFLCACAGQERDDDVRVQPICHRPEQHRIDPRRSAPSAYAPADRRVRQPTRPRSGAPGRGTWLGGLTDSGIRTRYAVVYRTEYVSGDPTPSAEITHVQWVPVDQVPDLRMDRSHRMRVEWALDSAADLDRPHRRLTRRHQHRTSPGDKPRHQIIRPVPRADLVEPILHGHVLAPRPRRHIRAQKPGTVQRMKSRVDMAVADFVQHRRRGQVRAQSRRHRSRHTLGFPTAKECACLTLSWPEAPGQSVPKSVRAT